MLENPVVLITLVVTLTLLCVSAITCVLLFRHRKRLSLQLAESQKDLISAQQNLVESQTRHRDQAADLNAKLQVSEMREQEQVKHHQLMNAQLVKSQEKLQKDFETLSARVFEESRKKFEDQSKKALDSSLDPLKKEIEQFRKRVEHTHQEDLRDRNRLQGQIVELQKQAQQIGHDAIQLASALKGENKSQGNWGELVLERLLEDSGLEKGREYKTQSSYSDEEGARKQPDVVVHLPENKDIIIDSKVSLVAYERYFHAESDAERDAAIKAHLQSLRAHFTGLSKKNYEGLSSLNSLDFVFMFIPVEPAYVLALQSDPELFQQAYDKQVVMVSPTTLMATLRTVANIWRYEKQNLNAQKIAEDAGGLYDQFALLVESLDELGKRIDSAQKSYEQARKRLSDGRGNIIKRVENLRKLGAKSKKNLPDSVKSLGNDSSDD